MSVKSCGAVNHVLPFGILGDIGNPELVRASSTKVVINEMASGSKVGFPAILAFGGKAADSIASHDFVCDILEIPKINMTQFY